MVDALDRVGGDAQAHVAAERFADERHVDEVRQEAALGLDVGVADLVADEGALGRQFAAARHGRNPLLSPKRFAAAILGATGANSVSLQGAGGRIGGKGRDVKATGRFWPVVPGRARARTRDLRPHIRCHRPA